ncbi:melanization protease 1-like isoform X2 [Anoplophora glabripennis]|uniref:melanization protease 1-like isoform X2 n=1 Tax=Anoplophora glabripennis TaxID=217634 RepID=UPI000C7930C9|nr:melanization protease 1-like isoform X2 [Anoplophora glabripennis]
MAKNMRSIPVILMCCLVIVKAFNIVVNISSDTTLTSSLTCKCASDGIHVDIYVNTTHHGSHSSVTDRSRSNKSTGNIDDKSPKTRRAGELSEKKCGTYYPPTPIPYMTRRRRYEQNPLSGQSAPEYDVHHLYKGKQTLAREFPHMALIGRVKKNNSFVQWFCGGSLISHSFVLTAAHCLISDKLVVRLGELDTSTEMDDANPQDIGIKKLFPHPEFNTSTHYHDIGLIELEKQVTLSGYVAIACLDNHKEVDEQHMLKITGWGQTELAGRHNSYLLKGNVYVKPHIVCKESYKKTSKLPIGIRDDIQICAVGPDNEDTCKGKILTWWNISDDSMIFSGSKYRVILEDLCKLLKNFTEPLEYTVS